jgi:hypothetical protein
MASRPVEPGYGPTTRFYEQHGTAHGRADPSGCRRGGAGSAEINDGGAGRSGGVEGFGSDDASVTVHESKAYGCGSIDTFEQRNPLIISLTGDDNDS